MSGFLISIEGIDGCGKSSLAATLKDELAAAGYKVLLTREPGGTKLGEKLKDILHKQKEGISDKAEYLLFATDRAQHFEEVVIPALKNNSVVISDRMADSSLAYQGYGRQLDLDLISSINDWAMQGIKPDLTFYLKIDPSVAAQRIEKRKMILTSFEKETKQFFERVMVGFSEIFAKRTNVIILDATCRQQEVAAAALEAVLVRIKKNGT